VKDVGRGNLSKKRGPLEDRALLDVKVIKPPEGNSCCGGTGRKRPPSASAELDMGKPRENVNAARQKILQP
jgi:hypothetical protein